MNILLIILGLELGSFSNVCIFRWPRNLSVYWPMRSHCPWCNKQISWWENIPVFSYLFLRGHCSSCHSKISIQYPIVEILFPFLLVLCCAAIGESELNVLFVIGLFFFVFTVLVTTVTDLEWRIIPDENVFLLAGVGLAIAPSNPLTSTYSGAFFGGLSIGCALWVISFLGRKIIGKEILGMGDVKLLAAFGFFMGAGSAVSVFILGGIIGGIFSCVGLIFHLLRRKQYIPFGPFLNAGALVEFFLRANNSSMLNLIYKYIGFA